MASKYQIVYTMQYFDDFNSIADYYIDEVAKTVYMERILYGGMDFDNAEL